MTCSVCRFCDSAAPVASYMRGKRQTEVRESRILQKWESLPFAAVCRNRSFIYGFTASNFCLWMQLFVLFCLLRFLTSSTCSWPCLSCPCVPTAFMNLFAAAMYQLCAVASVTFTYCIVNFVVMLYLPTLLLMSRCRLSTYLQWL